jgi:two-component system, NtrC family, sensor kinase
VSSLSDVESSLSPLQALADLSARLAETADLDATMPDLLARAASALGARRCSVWWLGDRAVPEPRWEADVAERDAVAAALRAPANGGAANGIVPLRAAGTVVGALVVDGAPSATGDDVLPARAVADLLGPALAHAERVARHADQVASQASAIEAERRLIESVVDALPFGLYVVDRDYRVQFWNRKRETDTLGIAREDALGRSIFDVLSRQNADVMRREFDEALATGQIQQFQIESRSTGELRTYRLTKIPMRADGGEPTHVVTIGEDITDWKAALERTAQSEKLAAIGQLAAGVMHEINNPLATIAACAETMTLGIAELPASRPAPPGFPEYLRIIDHEVHRCRGIIDGLLNFSRAKPVQRVTVGLNGIVEQTLFLLKHHGRFKRYPVRLELADGSGPEVTGDPDQLTQVLMALLLNAADALGEPTPDADDLRGIMIRTGRDGTDAYIEVEDEGQGIPREDLTKIFEPFYTTKGPGAGTGLGLSICYGIVRDHAGRIEIDSTVGEGTTFRVLLPLAG